MRKALLLPLFLVAASLCLGQVQEAPLIVETKPLDPADEAKQFVLPKGFEVQLVASDPDIRKPLNMAFDELGRLWVTDTIEYPYPAAKGTKPRDTVKILSNFQADGRAGKIETFADALNMPKPPRPYGLGTGSATIAGCDSSPSRDGASGM